jgi:hypothetical protein
LDILSLGWQGGGLGVKSLARQIFSKFFLDLIFFIVDLVTPNGIHVAADTLADGAGAEMWLLVNINLI